MRIAVIGAGGTGGYFGGVLARAGNDVSLLARGAHLETLRSRGLTVKSGLAGDFTLPVQATDNPHEIGPVDLVMFCVKGYDTDAAAELIQPLMASETVVLPLQNGIDAAERLTPFVGKDHVLGGVAFITASITEPGTIRQTGGAGKILLGEMEGGGSLRTRRILQTLQSAGIPAQVHDNIQIAIWEKFVFICGFGGVTALTRLPIGPVLASPEGCELTKGVMKEAALVAQASGVPLTDDAVKRCFALAQSFEPWARGSLYHDLAAGRRMELDVLNGTVVRLAGLYGVSVPFNFVVYAALQPYAQGAVPDFVNASADVDHSRTPSERPVGPISPSL